MQTPEPTLPAGAQPDAAPAQGCQHHRCGAPATYAPVLVVVQHGHEHVSRVALPVRLCAAHRAAFGEAFLTTERRATMEGALGSRGRALPDWSRTALEFVPFA